MSWWQGLPVGWRAVLIVCAMIVGLLVLQYASHMSTRV
jgi:hypothetical protein